MQPIHVIKASGLREPFSEEKLRQSIKRSGIPQHLENDVITHIHQQLHDNIPTSEIYKHITEYFNSSSEPFAKTKYSLKHSLMDLGPTGYPFEDLIAEILKEKGYSTIVRSIMQGKCVTHEIDVLAQINNKRIIVECKFHNRPGVRSDVHVPMYTKARFDDVKEENNIDEVWLVSNTKATTDAVQYGMCSGVKVFSWNYPENNCLRRWIEELNMHPITELSTLTDSQKENLLTHHVIVAREILDKPHMLDTLLLQPGQKQKVMEEVTYICNTNQLFNT